MLASTEKSFLRDKEHFIRIWKTCLKSSILDVRHILAMAVFAEIAGGSDNDVEAINTGLDGDLGILHVASYVGEDLCASVSQIESMLSVHDRTDLGLETQFADCFAVTTRLFGSSRAGQFNVVYTELIQRLGDLDLGLQVEVGAALH